MSPDRPDARELVDAVAQWLADDLAATLDGGARYQALVAAQALAMASRELAAAEADTAADADALGPLVPDAARDDPRAALRALTASIAAGEHDENLDGLAAVLREHVRRKVTVARPGYDQD